MDAVPWHGCGCDFHGYCCQNIPLHYDRNSSLTILMVTWPICVKYILPFPVNASLAIEEDAEASLPSPIFVNLAQAENAFDFADGFSRPDWKVIQQIIETTVNPEDREDAWDEVVVQWMTKFETELGGEYRLRESRHFVLLGSQDKDTCQRLLNFSEVALSGIRDSLGELAWGSHRGLNVVLLFDEEDDYYQYIANFYRDGTHPKSAGVYLKTGYPHVALLFDSELRTGETIAHELTHHCLGHLPIPLWLNEGVAVVLQKAIGGYSPPSYQGAASAYWGIVSGWKPPVMWAELAEKHHQFWNEDQIQKFWAGTSFHEPGDSVQLSYSLAEILVHLLAKNREDFLVFIQSAQRDDAGQTAALDCLGTCLGDAVGTFLGEGNWRPHRKAIKSCWETKRAAVKDSSDSGG